MIDWPAAIWQPILQGIILSIRPSRKGKDYESIWNKERNEGPLLTITRSQTEKLAAELAMLSDKIVVDFAMRYGNPATGPAIDNLLRQGLRPGSCCCRCIRNIPSRPRRRRPTRPSASSCGWNGSPPSASRRPGMTIRSTSTRWPPASASIWRGSISSGGAARLVPRRAEALPAQGRPLSLQCVKTARLLREALGWPKEKFVQTFQSRFGPEEW